jgi:adenosine deaminase
VSGSVRVNIEQQTIKDLRECQDRLAAVERERDKLRTACRDLLQYAANAGHWSAIRCSHGDCHCDDCLRADNALEAIRYARAALQAAGLDVEAQGTTKGE